MDATLFASRFSSEKEIASDAHLEGKGLEPHSLSVIVEPLRKGDIWKGTETWNDAFIHDPMTNYVSDPNQDKTARRVITSAALALWIETKQSLTINHGEALLISTPPEDIQHPIHRRLDGVLGEFLRLLGRLGSAEGKKRVKEADAKIKLAVQEAIGDSARDMWLVDLVCTNPQSQGSGYGSAMLDAIKARLDLSGKSAWLTSSNVANDAFYNSHGFFSVANDYLGDDNPKWDRKPVKVQITPAPKGVV
ncbi:hypothetical protein CPB83DRAFT_894698 [Crepidotus variabilis]|uniref:N-acetyltransferase domain-containing protein n=1 Tax=Crepidotus variabilis TaxID=179855 RepID=A0A9P6EF73_9AGAR|nr:hypothetical protein CPB83DRAFT_894698 [Crepidotus variabilis]